MNLIMEEELVSFLRVSGRTLLAFERFLVHGAALVMFVTMMIVVADVVSRYFFNSPIKWVYPLISRYLMIYMFFLALSDTLRRGQHIVIDFIFRWLSIRRRSLVELLAYLPSLAVFGLILWLGIDLTWLQYVNHDVIMDSLGWPTWITSLALPIGIGAMLLRIVLRIGALGVRMVNPNADVTEAYGEVDEQAVDLFAGTSLPGKHAIEQRKESAARMP